jgi:hypothetical protein
LCITNVSNQNIVLHCRFFAFLSRVHKIFAYRRSFRKAFFHLCSSYIFDSTEGVVN